MANPSYFPDGIAGGSYGNQNQLFLIDRYGRANFNGSFIAASLATFGAAAITLPTTAGQLNQVLTSDGANGTTWSTSGASSGVTSLAGTANQISVSAATGAVTLSLPQNINTAAAVTFASLTLTSGVLGSTNVTSLTATGAALFQGSTQINSLNVATLTASGATVLQSTLNVTGASTLGTASLGASTITSLNVNGGLTVTGAVALTSPLTVPMGGTGVATLTSGGVLWGNAAGTIQVTAQGGTNTVLTGTNGAPAFSATPRLTTLNLGVAASTAGTLTLSGATSGTVTLISSTAAGSWTMTLPTTGGSNGQFLQTNGSGLTTWATSSGVSFPLAQSVLFNSNNAYTIGDSSNTPSSTWTGLLRVGLSATLGSPTGDIYGANNSQFNCVFDTAVASTTSTGTIMLRQSRGTIASPSNNNSSDLVGSITMQGRVSGAFQTIGAMVCSFNGATTDGQVAFNIWGSGSLLSSAVRFDGSGNCVIKGTYYTGGGANAGISASGAFTNFTFAGGICTAAS